MTSQILFFIQLLLNLKVLNYLLKLFIMIKFDFFSSVINKKMIHIYFLSLSYRDFRNVRIY